MMRGEIYNQNSSLKMDLITKFITYLFFIVLVFDPGDLIFGLKLPLFLTLISLVIIKHYIHSNINLVPNTANIIVIGFILICLSSICIGLILNLNYDLSFGIAKLYSFMYLPLIYIILCYRFNYLKALINILMILNITVIIIAILNMLNVAPNLIDKLYAFGNQNGAFTISSRTYGGVEFPSIYFHSCPFLVLSVAYYAQKLIKGKKIFYLVLYLIAFIGMFLTGSRNNIIFSVIISIIVWFVYSDKKKWIVIFSLFAFIFLIIIEKDTISAMFSSSDISNNIKIQTIVEYGEFFYSNPIILIFGQGIGGMILSPVRGNVIVPITELSYLDIFRWFGLFGGIIIIFFMLYPLINIIKCHQKDNYWLAIAYGAFLIMIALNPFFFNSVGLTIYSLVLTTFLLTNERIEKKLEKGMKK